MYFDLRRLVRGRLSLETLTPPKPSPGLDDAPYFGVWSADGRLAALSNHTEAGAIRGYRASDGEDLGAIEVDNGDGSMGFAVQAERRRVWLPGAQPRAYEFAAAW